MSDNIKHNVLEKLSRYIILKKKELGLSNDGLAKACKISNGEISKLINMERQSISPKTFIYYIQGLTIISPISSTLFMKVMTFH